LCHFSFYAVRAFQAVTTLKNCRPRVPTIYAISYALFCMSGELRNWSVKVKRSTVLRKGCRSREREGSYSKEIPYFSCVNALISFSKNVCSICICPLSSSLIRREVWDLNKSFTLGARMQLLLFGGKKYKVYINLRKCLKFLSKCLINLYLLGLKNNTFIKTTKT